MLIILILVVLILASGGIGYQCPSQRSPVSLLGLILIIFLILILSGYLGGHRYF